MTVGCVARIRLPLPALEIVGCHGARWVYVSAWDNIAIMAPVL